jgi:hypothetical protein
VKSTDIFGLKKEKIWMMIQGWQRRGFNGEVCGTGDRIIDRKHVDECKKQDKGGGGNVRGWGVA